MSAAFNFSSLVLLATMVAIFTDMTRSNGMLCIESERVALLGLKHDIIDGSNRLGSWSATRGNEECCKWSGVVCDNAMGHVTELHLQNPHPDPHHASEGQWAVYARIKMKGKMNHSMLEYEEDFKAYEMSALRGNINPSLQEFKQLVYLNLSWNIFKESPIPSFIGSMSSSLRYLDLTKAGFVGVVPPQIGMLVGLRFLSIQGSTLHAENLDWITRLTYLEHLDLSYVNLSTVVDWLPVLDANLPSLVKLRLSSCHLQHIHPLPYVNFSSSLTLLDLSHNNLKNTSIPKWVFRLENLAYLDLSSNNFQGPIPCELRNLASSLKHLDLSTNLFNSSIPDCFYSADFNRNLEFLNLSSNELKGNLLPAIRNFASLVHLDLSYNLELEADPGGIFSSSTRLCNLKQLILSYVTLYQDVQQILQIQSLCDSNQLEFLSLSQTRLFGQLNDLGRLTNIVGIDLSKNEIVGGIPTSLGSLLSLRAMDISNNLMEGAVSEPHFANLTNLMSFIASHNLLKLEVGPNWVPPFQVRSLDLRSWHLGPQFPLWLRSQKRLMAVDISNSGISSTVPNWFWNMLSSPSPFFYLNISNNQLTGKIPDLSTENGPPSHVFVLDFSSNNFSGPLPRVSSNLAALDLSNNSFSGSISHFLCYEPNVSKEMQILNLGGNLLSGDIPDCWTKWDSLVAIKLSNNNFSGTIPSSVSKLKLLQSLHLRNNKLNGPIPSALKNCSRLMTLDLGENQFGGKIPKWMGKSFLNLVILILRSNKFYGSMPKELCGLSKVQIMDLAHNGLSGHVPRCINNFTAMITPVKLENNIQYNLVTTFNEDALLVMKGKLDEYGTILNLVRIFDISQNNFSGQIPEEVTSLIQLQSLNLSHNSLTGRIPQDIGSMRSLLSLDLSVNRLYGEIPETMSKLTFLSQLNLSNNDLIGEIPSSTQLQSFNASSFDGNRLCGPPLIDKCSTKSGTNHTEDQEGGGGSDMVWFYTSMAYGFAVGFWFVIGPLVFIRRWRHAYYGFLESCISKIRMLKLIVYYVTVVKLCDGLIRD